MSGQALDRAIHLYDSERTKLIIAPHDANEFLAISQNHHHLFCESAEVQERHIDVSQSSQRKRRDGSRSKDSLSTQSTKAPLVVKRTFPSIDEASTTMLILCEYCWRRLCERTSS